MVDLDLEIVVSDLDRFHFDFFKLTAANTGAGLVGFLLLLIAPLAVVHDLTDRRAGVGGHFDEVKPKFAGATHAFGSGGGTYFVVVLIDQKDGRDPDLFVVTEVGGNGRVLLCKDFAGSRHTPRHRHNLLDVSTRPTVAAFLKK